MTTTEKEGTTMNDTKAQAAHHNPSPHQPKKHARYPYAPSARAPMTLDALCDSAYAQSFASGFWEATDSISNALYDLDRDAHDAYRRTVIAEKLALIHSEVSEVLEEVRAGRAPTEAYYREDGKPEGIPSELADVVIRIGDLCGAMGIDLNAAVHDKMRFNRTREHLHGKKF